MRGAKATVSEAKAVMRRSALQGSSLRRTACGLEENTHQTDCDVHRSSPNAHSFVSSPAPQEQTHAPPTCVSVFASYRNARSIQLVELSTVVMETAADSCVLKLARLLVSAPAPVLLNSANVTWSVLDMLVSMRLDGTTAWDYAYCGSLRTEHNWGISERVERQNLSTHVDPHTDHPAAGLQRRDESPVSHRQQGARAATHTLLPSWEFWNTTRA